MRNTLIVLMVTAVAIIFYWQFFAPAFAPASQGDSAGEQGFSFEE